MHSLISRPAILLSLIAVAATVVSAGDQALAPGQYVTVRDGHLFHSGQRLRLWGADPSGFPSLRRLRGTNLT